MRCGGIDRVWTTVALVLLLAPMSPVHGQVVRSVTNGGFEANNPGGNPGFQIFTSAEVPGWDATPNEIELWDNNLDGVPAHSGNVFDELNTTGPTTLYQNICLVNGEAMRWSFAHRARINGGAAATQTVSFQVANSGGTVLQTLTTQASTTAANAWTVNSNTTGLPYIGATGLQRVQFNTTNTGNAGNFLDSVSFDLAPYVELQAAASGSETVPNANIPRLLVSGNITSPLIVPVTVTGGSATLGFDYTTPSGGATFNVTIPAGNYIQQSIALGIDIINETEVEGNETIDLSVGTAPSWVVSSTATCNSAGRGATTYTIQNDDVPRVAGTPPTLTCPVGTTVFDWDARTWTAGSLNNSYTQTGIGQINFAITNPNGTFGNNPTYGGQTPARQNTITGGLTPAQFSLALLTDMVNQSARATTTITLPTAVPGAQFRIFDVDYAAGAFADLITVTGSFGGTSVTPILTNGVSNFVVGNTAIGDANFPDTSGDANVVVTFDGPVDTIVVAYGNHTTAPVNPTSQAIALHDITFCNPQAVLTPTKFVNILSDPVNGTTNPKFIPGAVVRYCVLVTNAGSGTAAPVNMNDPLPTATTYVAGSMLSGTSCAGAATVEDDNNVGGDEADPVGASITGSTITGTTGTLGPNTAFALVFNVTLN